MAYVKVPHKNTASCFDLYDNVRWVRRQNGVSLCHCPAPQNLFLPWLSVHLLPLLLTFFRVLFPLLLFLLKCGHPSAHSTIPSVRPLLSGLMASSHGGAPLLMVVLRGERVGRRTGVDVDNPADWSRNKKRVNKKTNITDFPIQVPIGIFASHPGSPLSPVRTTHRENDYLRNPNCVAFVSLSVLWSDHIQFTNDF